MKILKTVNAEVHGQTAVITSHSASVLLTLAMDLARETDSALADELLNKLKGVGLVHPDNR